MKTNYATDFFTEPCLEDNHIISAAPDPSDGTGETPEPNQDDEDLEPCLPNGPCPPKGPAPRT